MSKDSNSDPALVTGYRVWRTRDPRETWSQPGSNVGDEDPGIPDIQCVGATSVGDLEFYEVEAWDEVCGIEGPR